MNKQEKVTIAVVFAFVLMFLAVHNTIQGSGWVFDNLIGIVLLVLMFLMAGWMYLDRTGFIMFNIALLVHNLGSFGLYELSFGSIAYDNLTHFLGAFVAAYIVFNFIAKKLHVRKHKTVKETVIDDHKVVMMLLVFAFVAMLGTVVELAEFIGFTYLGEGEGMLLYGAGDSTTAEDVAGQYRDTMGDIVVNTIGTLFGVLVYYNFKYKRKCWMRSCDRD